MAAKRQQPTSTAAEAGAATASATKLHVLAFGAYALACASEMEPKKRRERESRWAIMTPHDAKNSRGWISWVNGGRGGLRA